MSAKGLFFYVSMILIAGGIAFFYIQPTFSEISVMQDEIVRYQDERTKVDSVNQQLADLVARLETVPASDQQKLLTYIPNEVDTIAVSRTLQTIAQTAGVSFWSVSYDGLERDYVSETERGGITDYPVPHVFQFSVEGSYQQIKDMIRVAL
jgi:predicted PurR-regulated permease PerM